MMFFCQSYVFLFQAEDGIRDLVRSRGLGDVYKRQGAISAAHCTGGLHSAQYRLRPTPAARSLNGRSLPCLLYTSDAADERSSVDLGGRRIIKKKRLSKKNDIKSYTYNQQ